MEGLRLQWLAHAPGAFTAAAAAGAGAGPGGVKCAGNVPGSRPASCSPPWNSPAIRQALGVACRGEAGAMHYGGDCQELAWRRLALAGGGGGRARRCGQGCLGARVRAPAAEQVGLRGAGLHHKHIYAAALQSVLQAGRQGLEGQPAEAGQMGAGGVHRVALAPEG